MQVHFIIALSKYYKQLRREKAYDVLPSSSSKEQHSLQRIYLLPTPTSSSFPPISFNHHSCHASNNTSRGNARSGSDDYYYRDDPSDDVLVYAPIPMSRLSLEDAKGMHATEAWISAAPPPSSRAHKHHHHHRHHLHSSGSSRSHRHRSSVSLNAPYTDEAEELLMVTGEKAV